MPSGLAAAAEFTSDRGGRFGGAPAEEQELEARREAAEQPVGQRRWHVLAFHHARQGGDGEGHNPSLGWQRAHATGAEAGVSTYRRVSKNGQTAEARARGAKCPVDRVQMDLTWGRSTFFHSVERCGFWVEESECARLARALW